MSELEGRKQRILDELKNGPKGSTELQESVKDGPNSMKKDTLFKNIRELEAMGLVKHYEDSNTRPIRRYYELVTKPIVPREKSPTKSRVEKNRIVLDVGKLSWLDGRIATINELTQGIQVSYAKVATTPKNKDTREIKQLIDKFTSEALSIVDTLDSRYREFNIVNGNFNHYDYLHLVYGDILGHIQVWQSGADYRLFSAVDRIRDFRNFLIDFYAECKKRHTV